MDYTSLLSIPKGAAVCYSGFRVGQRPGDVYPSYEQVKEDLTIVQNHWRYIRLYSCDHHAQTVLEVIRNEQLPLQVMLGAYLDGLHPSSQPYHRPSHHLLLPLTR